MSPEKRNLLCESDAECSTRQAHSVQLIRDPYRLLIDNPSHSHNEEETMLPDMDCVSRLVGVISHLCLGRLFPFVWIASYFIMNMLSITRVRIRNASRADMNLRLAVNRRWNVRTVRNFD